MGRLGDIHRRSGFSRDLLNFRQSGQRPKLRPRPHREDLGCTCEQTLSSLFPLVSGHIVESVINHLRGNGKFIGDRFSHFNIVPADSVYKEAVAFKPLEALYTDIMSSPIAHHQLLATQSRLVVAGNTPARSSRISTSRPDSYILFDRQSSNSSTPLWSDVIVPFEFKKTDSESFRKDVRCLSNLGPTC